MKKTPKLALFVCFALIACTIMFSACNSDDNANKPETEAHIHEFGEWFTVKESTCTENGKQERLCICGEKETQDMNKLAHTFGDWQIVKESSYTEEGIKARYCSCGESESMSINKKTPQTISLTTDNFWEYFSGTYEYVYNEYFGGKIFNYGTIDVTLVCAQKIPGDIANVTISLALYPRGGRWDATNFEDDDRLVNIAISTKTGVGTGSKHMGFSTTHALSSNDVRQPDTIDVVIVSVTGTITIYP